MELRVRERKSRLLAFALLIASLVAVGLWSTPTTAPAAADDSITTVCIAWSPPLDYETPCKTDDLAVNFCTAEPWPLSYGNRFGAAMVNLDSQTVLSDHYNPTCLSHTDLGGHFNFAGGEVVLNNNTLGLYLCTKKIPGSSVKCDRASIILNQASSHFAWVMTNLGEASWRLAIQHTLCHEIGHGVGLAHTNSHGGCMQSGLAYVTSYSTHHVNLINAAYP